MKNSKYDIDEKIPRHDGMNVPEGYFDDFASRMTEMLPERPELSELMDGPGAAVMAPRSTWQRIRPYVYMAAMFAGVWCMLKLFTLLTSDQLVPFESNPIVAEALSNDSFVNEYVVPDFNQWDLYDDLMNDGISPEEFLDSVAFSQMGVPSEYLQ